MLLIHGAAPGCGSRRLPGAQFRLSFAITPCPDIVKGIKARPPPGREGCFLIAFSSGMKRRRDHHGSLL